MITMRKERIVLACMLLIFVIAVTACSFDDDNDVVIGKDVLALNKIEKEQPTDADGLIRISAIITGADEAAKTITAKTILLGDNSDYNSTQKEYSLKYSGATDIRNAYDTIISASQLGIGQIVNVVYDSGLDRIKSIHIDGDYFEITGLRGVQISKKDHSLTYGNKMYSYGDSVLVFDGDSLINIDALSTYDEITIRGRNNKIYSISKTRGHGYLKLSGYSQFIGGYIEIGDTRVLKVVEDMSIPVTEGTYKVIISNKGVMATRNITIEHDKTVLAEFEEYLKNPSKQGNVEFILSPLYAKLYIDGVKTDYEELVALDYGIHTYTVVCNGYDNVISTFVVDSSYDKIEIILDKNSTTKNTKDATISETEKNTDSKGTQPATAPTLPDMPTLPTWPASSVTGESSAELPTTILDRLLN